MNPIPLKLRKELEADPYYKQCCLTGVKEYDSHIFRDNKQIDWHHCWKYAGKQINEKWAIMPVWYMMHTVDKNSVHKNRIAEIRVKLMSLERALAEDLLKYPKIDWEREKRRLTYDLIHQ